MGDRVSIQFAQIRGDYVWYSAVLKDHWGGSEFPQQALEFVRSINIETRISTPLSRLEPSVVMVAFVQHLASPESLRLVPTKNDCDNSDNGHFIIWTDSLTIEKEDIR